MQEEDVSDVTAAFRRLYTSMLGANTDCLGDLLTGQFTLTHMTGVLQSKSDWLADIIARRMVYHAAREISVSVTTAGDTATVVGRHVVDATIYGIRGRWRLQLTTRFIRHQRRWLAQSIVASTFR